jgi:hypothetical protein
MIVDLRTYRVRPNKMSQELDLYARHGLAPQVRHLGPPPAYLFGESGDINTLVHLWVFKDAADRASKLVAMASDPERRTHLKLAEKADFLSTVGDVRAFAAYCPLRWPRLRDGGCRTVRRSLVMASPGERR